MILAINKVAQPFNRRILQICLSRKESSGHPSYAIVLELAPELLYLMTDDDLSDIVSLLKKERGDSQLRLNQENATPKKEEPVKLQPFPMQPMIQDKDGVCRFQANRLVRYLLDKGGIDMNHLARAAHHEKWSDEEQQQFAQLIGYSVSGYGDLSYVDDEAYSKAAHASHKVVRHFRTDSHNE